MGTAQVRECTEAEGARQIQVQQQQVDLRMPFEGLEQPRDAVGFENSQSGAGRRNGALQRRAEQRMVIDDEDFVVHPWADHSSGPRMRGLRLWSNTTAGRAGAVCQRRIERQIRIDQ
jgi:hypothetical protein